MKLRTLFLTTALAAAACSAAGPLPVAAGDTCFRCRRIVEDPRLAAEMIDSGGRAFKFRSALCLATYLKQHPEDSGRLFVTDFTTGRMFAAKSATFVPTIVGRGRDKTKEYVAYTASADARTAASSERTATTDWAGVVAAAPAN